MKKIISILACVCLLLTAIVIPVSAAETTATIVFDDSSKAQWSSEQQLWQENGIAVTNNKAASSTAINVEKKYSNPARFYQGSDIIIEYPGMTKIELIIPTATYAKVWVDTNKDTNATITYTDTAYSTGTGNQLMTITFATPVDSFTLTKLTAQTRVRELTVYTGDSAGGTTPTPPVEEPEGNPAPDDTNTLTIAEAIELGSNQADGGYTTDKYYVTGTITAVANTQYGNFYIADENGTELYVYGLYSEDGTTRYDGLSVKPDEGDIVTLYSVVGNYKGTPQLKNAWLTAHTAGELEEPTLPDPDADSTLTIVEAKALGESKKSNVYTEGKYYVTGVITEVYNTQYGNMYISDENGNTLTVYGTYSEDGSTRYDAMDVKPVAGDTIVVYGIIGNYNGTAQMKNGWITEIKAPIEETFEGLDPEAPIELAVNESVPATLKEIKVPAAGTVFVKVADANGIFHVTSTTGACLLINGRSNQVEISDAYDLTLCGYEMVNIYNSGEETITLYAFLEAGAGEVFGTMENPEVLEFMENPYMPSFPPSAEALTELEAGNQGYFYKVIAPKDCILVINVSASDAEWNTVGYQYNVTNNETSWQSDFIVKAPDADDYYDSLFVNVKAGDEIIINAGTFNPEDRWNAPAGTLNVCINTTTVGSSDYPEVLTETGTYSATVEAGSYGYNYEYTAEADGVVTVTMNDESWTYVVNNLTSYKYGDTQWSDSDPVVPSTSVDVKAGDLISIMVSTYDPADPWNAPAGTVNWTLSFEEKVSKPGVFSIDDAEVKAGQEFTVAINVSENPGIISAVLDIIYDKDVLELVKAEAGDFNKTVTSNGEEIACYNFSEDFTRINWVDALALENNTANGTFAVLTFKVKDGAEGSTEISFTVDAENTFNVDFEDVEFDVDGATITIKDGGMPGDANGDGKVNNKDLALLVQHLSDWDVEIDLGCVDVNADGKVNNKDSALLMQYLNDWDVELK